MRQVIILHLSIGILLTFIGLWAGARPYSLLDVVLTQNEIHNQELADSTLSLLKQGAGNDSSWMFGSGLVLVVTSYFALRHRPVPG